MTTVSDTTRVKVAEWVMWLEWHHGIDGDCDLSDLPLFTYSEEKNDG